MFNEEQINAEKKSSLLNYVGDFIEKRDNVSRKTTGDDRTRSFDKDLVTINTSEGTFQHSNLVSLITKIIKKKIRRIFHRMIELLNRLI